ncbi:MAG: type IV pilin [Thermoplasmatales archaeon]|jgi:flagellin-like protein|nr:type IV pilin [Candidatus Thermoplasmatota archaeon]MDA8055259.1 type IV pilin [Thermoplasmatales archaeon]
MKEVVRRVHKKTWPLRLEKDEAVSPVIATILMVAVTVVLAAAVYLLVSYYVPSPGPLIGSLTEESSNSNSTTLMLTLASPTSLKNPSYFHLQILNSTATGVGWTVQNVTITNPDGSVLYMNTFTSSGDVWTSNGAVPINGATSIESGAMIYILFHSDGKQVVISDFKVVINYSGTTGSITASLN